MELRLPVVRALLVSGITAAFACGGGAEVIDTTPDAPSAIGSVRIERRADRLALHILVQELAPPDEVKRGAAAYVVWAKPARGGRALNLGALALDADEGVLRTAMAAEDASLIVTAEPTAQAGSPTGQPVLWAYVDVADPPAPAEPAPAEVTASAPEASVSPEPAAPVAPCEP